MGLKIRVHLIKLIQFRGLTINLEKATSEPIKITIEDSNVKDSIDLIKNER